MYLSGRTSEWARLKPSRFSNRPRTDGKVIKKTKKLTPKRTNEAILCDTNTNIILTNNYKAHPYLLTTAVSYWLSELMRSFDL